MFRWLVLVFALGWSSAAGAAIAGDGLVEAATGALSRAAGFFVDEVTVEGSYLWVYSEDLSERRGEGDATDTMGWVQPPGTPSVGEAYLNAYEATGDATYLDAALNVARALNRSQLASGGWDYRIEFDSDRRKRWHYRSDVESGDTETGDRRNTSTYDDNNTQSALRFLMRLDAIEDGAFEPARVAIDYGLMKLLRAQYPNGAWPQRYADESWDETGYPVLKARYPESWSKTWPRPHYRGYYTFNDNAIRDVIRVFMRAHEQYGDERYRKAALRGGDFMLLAQMPEPQPVWAQQYNYQMEPAWARRFEPASVTGGESSGVARALIDLYLETGERRFFDAVGPAIEWYERSSISDGRWARFYELKTNRPLYFTKEYELVYSDDDLPTHYSFQSSYGVTSLQRYHAQVAAKGREAYLAERDRPMTNERRLSRIESMASSVRDAIAAMDERGRWVEDGEISTRTFNRNVSTLAEYIRLAKKEGL